MNRFFVSALMMMLAATVAAGTQVVRITQPQHLRRAMNENGFAGVKLHGFGN